MGWVETWLDAAPAPDFNTCVAAAQQAGAQSFNAYLGGRYLFGGPWPPLLVSALSQAGYGVFGTWVSLRPGEGGYDLGHQDGLDCLSTAGQYPEIELLCYDIEPATWNQNPALTLAAMNGFADAVGAAGRPAMIYGVQATLLGAVGYSRYWATFDLASQDPALSAGGEGARSVQYVQQVIANATWDLSHSEFSVRQVAALAASRWFYDQGQPRGRG